MSDSSLDSLYIYGTGEHARVVAESAAAAGLKVLGFIDEKPATHAIGMSIVLTTAPPEAAGKGVIVAVGDAMARRRIAADLAGQGLVLANVYHPTAWVSPSAILGKGIYVGPQAVVNARAQIENGVIINSAAVVEHDCVVEAFTNIGPRAVLTGGIHVGSLCDIGAAAVINPGIKIGDDSRVGSGAVVLEDVAANQTVVGVPAHAVQPKPRATAV